ncbi:unnamed protein product [Lactuca saligna]|uniref:Uncharacterized protein n=1 Tax=Lactuca saligna TaxID=75948 RepID=A0AA35ZBJ0_LACSI|nr:unnamed protein product [Lactuca saligna]
MQTLNVVNKVVAFEMICRANDYLPDYFMFKYFFRFCCTGDKYTFSGRQRGYTLVLDGRTPKIWQDKWLWVNQGLAGSGRYRANTFADTPPKLFPHNQGVADFLKNVQRGVPIARFFYHIPPPGKVGIYHKTLDAGIRLPLTEFQEEVLQKDGCSVQMQTLNVVNKVVAFEMICRANDYLPDYFMFKYFFRFCCTGDKYTFSGRQRGYTLVLDGRTPKIWQDKWLWVNQGLAGSGRYRANTFADTPPKLFPHNQGVADFLKNVQVLNP